LFNDLPRISFKRIYKNPFTNRINIAIIYKTERKELIEMKVLYAVPTDIDELIFPGETTVPSDR